MFSYNIEADVFYCLYFLIYIIKWFFVHLQVDPVHLHGFSKNQNEPYVMLVAESNDVFREKEMIFIPLSTRRGYIFIQTDKTIYNPGEIGKKSELCMETRISDSRSIVLITLVLFFFCFVLFFQ